MSPNWTINSKFWACKECFHIYSDGTSRTTMAEHIKDRHFSVNSMDKTQTAIDKNQNILVPATEELKKRFKNIVVESTIQDNRQFSWVEGEGMRILLQECI